MVVTIPLYEFWNLIHIVATGAVNLQRTPFGCKMGRHLQENFNSNQECVGGPSNEWTWVQEVHCTIVLHRYYSTGEYD